MATKQKQEKMSKESYAVSSKFIGTLRSKIRQIWLWSPGRSDALKAAKVGSMYRCKGCQKLFEKHAVNVDHVVPCGSMTEIAHLSDWVERLMLGELQILCKENCHKGKTKNDNKAIRAAKKEPGKVPPT